MKNDTFQPANSYGHLIQFASEDTLKPTFQSSTKGSIYRKQLAKYGEWVNPQYPFFSNNPIITLDESWGDKIVQNFNDNVLGHAVAVPATHTSDPEKNRGRVLSVESVPGDGLYGELLILEDQTVEALDKGTIFDCSIQFDWNYIRKDNNKNCGPTLQHVALVNDPYLSEMNSFEKMEAALSKSFGSNGVSLAGNNVIMLSEAKMKELSNMGTKTIKNDKGFDITVKFNDGVEDKELVIKAGEEVEVPDEAADDVTTQVTDAVEPEADDDNADANNTGEETAEEKAAEELSKLKEENAALKLSKAFDDLLNEGKVIPAQRDAVMALAKLPQGVSLSKDGSSTDIATVVLGILGAGAQQFSKDESGSSQEDPNAAQIKKDQEEEGKKPSESLSEEELAGFKAVGADPQKMDELAEKAPGFREALASMSK